MKPEVRDRFSGTVEAFSRRNVSSSGLHGDHSRHRSSEHATPSKDLVSLLLLLNCSCDPFNYVYVGVD